MSRSDSTRLLLWTAVALAAIAGGYLLFLQSRIITSPGPLEYREPAIVITTDLLLHGQNPYALENQPTYTNVYGPFYHWTVVPFARMFGNGFAVHRVMSGLFLLGCCAVMFWAVRRSGASGKLAWVAVVLLYADLAGRCTPMVPFAMPFSTIARPDALGLLLLLLSVLLPLGTKFSRVSLAVSLLASILAFFTKPYFAIGLPIVSLYLFLFRNKAVGALYGGAFLTIFIASLYLVTRRYEAFIPILKANNLSVMLKYSFFWEQLRQYVANVPGSLMALLIIAALGLAKQLRVLRAGDPRTVGWVFPLNRPLLNLPVDFLWFAMLCCGLLLVFKLGPHIGNAMLYLYQLFSPFLLLIVFRGIARHRRWQPLLLSLIVLDCVLLLARGLPAPPTARHDAWDRWAKLLSDAKNPYVAPPLAWIAQQQGKPVYDNGMSEFFIHATLYPSTDMDKRVVDRMDRFRAQMNQMTRREQFDLLVIPYSGKVPMPTMLKNHVIVGHYRVVEWIALPMDWSPGFVGAVMVPQGNPAPN